MGYHTYLVREDNKTRFELGKLQYGLQNVFRELEDIRRQAVILSDPEILAEFILDQIIERPRFWTQPRDYIPFAQALAERLVRWGGGQPVVCLGESQLRDRWWPTTDSIHESEWPYFDVFQKLQPELWPQIDTMGYSPSEARIVSYVKSFRLSNYKRLKSDAERKAFLEEMAQLKPLTTNRDCGILGCLATGPHDHGLCGDHCPAPMLLYCGCGCHHGEPIFCSCWVPCCHQPGTPRAQQTPRPPAGSSNVKLGDFKTFTMPVIRPEGGFPKLI